MLCEYQDCEYSFQHLPVIKCGQTQKLQVYRLVKLLMACLERRYQLNAHFQY